MGYHKNTFKLQDYRSSKIREAFRCSLENFGEFEYEDPEDNNAIRHVCLGLGRAGLYYSISHSKVFTSSLTAKFNPTFTISLSFRAKALS